jgi:hypothetical protein
MPRRKPLGWPRYMVARHLKSGAISFFWYPPSWAKRNACPLQGEPLGSDYGNAKSRCDEILNPQFDAWVRREEAVAPPTKSVGGTFDWMVATYKSSPKYQELPAKTRKSYDSALRLVSEYKLKNGRFACRFGR